MCGIILKFSPPVLKVENIGNRFWAVLGPDGVQIGEPYGTSRAAYTRMWYLYKDPSWYGKED